MEFTIAKDLPDSVKINNSVRTTPANTPRVDPLTFNKPDIDTKAIPQDTSHLISLIVQ